MNTVRGFLKKRLPPRVSFRLRCLKSGIVDEEMGSLELFAKALGGNDAVALDVGANAGIYSNMLARHFGRVLCVEPHPDCASYMRAVLPRNCTVIEAAASDERGSVTLRVPLSGGALNSTRGTISPDNRFQDIPLSGTREVVVEAMPLDDLLAGELARCSALGLLKVDVEGHELAAIAGARAIVEKWRPGLYIEIEARHGTKTVGLLHLLRELGYEVVRLADGKLVPDTSFPDPEAGARVLAGRGTVNVMLLPRAR